MSLPVELKLIQALTTPDSQ